MSKSGSPMMTPREDAVPGTPEGTPAGTPRGSPRGTIPEESPVKHGAERLGTPPASRSPGKMGSREQIIAYEKALKRESMRITKLQDTQKTIIGEIRKQGQRATDLAADIGDLHKEQQESEQRLSLQLDTLGEQIKQMMASQSYPKPPPLPGPPSVATSSRTSKKSTKERHDSSDSDDDGTKLVKALTKVVASSHGHSDEWDREREEKKELSHFRKWAPTFDGSETRRVEPWLRLMQKHLDDLGIESEKRRALAVIECLKGTAADFIGSCYDKTDTFEQVSALLKDRFGMSRDEQRGLYRSLRQGQKDNVREYFDRFCQLSEGLGYAEEDLVVDFRDGLRDDRTYSAVQYARPKTLAEALNVAVGIRERAATSSTRGATRESSIRCNHCSKLGHIARNCPAKKSGPASKRVNVVEEVSEEELEVDQCEYSGSDDEWDVEEKRAAEEALPEENTAKRALIRQVPVQQLPRENRYFPRQYTAARRKEESAVVKGMHGKVDIETSLLAGLILGQTKDPSKTANELTRRATKQVQGWEATLKDVNTIVLDVNDVGGQVGVEARYVQVRLAGNNTVHYGLYDTGAQVSVMSSTVLEAAGSKWEWTDKSVRVRGFTSGVVVCRVAKVKVAMGRNCEEWIEHPFCIVPSTEYKLIMGLDLMGRLGAEISMQQQRITFTTIPNRSRPLRLPLVPRSIACTSRAWKGHLQDGQPKTSLAASLREAVEVRCLLAIGEDATAYLGLELAEVATVSHQVEWEEKWENIDDIQINATETDSEGETHVTIYCDATVNEWLKPLVSAHSIHELNDLSLQVSTPPDHAPYLSADRLFTPGDALLAAMEIYDEQKGNFQVAMAMTGQDEVVIPQQKTVGKMGAADLPVGGVEKDGLSREELKTFLQQWEIKELGDEKTLQERCTRVAHALDTNSQLICSNRTAKEKQQLVHMLVRQGLALATKVEHLTQPADVTPLPIDTGSAKPIRSRPYRQTAEENAFLEETVKTMQTAGVVRRSTSSWGFPTFVVYKKEMGKKVMAGKKRKVVDFRKLNSVVSASAYPLPPLDQQIDKVKQSKFLGAVDLKSGYWQVPIVPEHAERAAFVTQFGLFQYERAPFGFVNSGCHFMHAVDVLMTEEDLQRHNMAYVDDVTTFGDTWEQYLEEQEKLLEALGRRHWLVAADKLRLGYEKIQVLGWLVGGGQKTADEKKLDGLLKLVPPTNPTLVKSFLGAIGWYRDLIPRIGERAIPLTQLLKKTVPWQWGEKQQESWEDLRNALLSQPTLYLPVQDADYILYTDWSANGIAAALHQVQNGCEVPICFKSRACRGAEQKYGSAEGELLAAVWAMGKLRQYLHGKRFTLITDSSALTALKTTANMTGKLARWGMILGEYDFEIKHRKGTQMGHVDGLNRSELPSEPIDLDDQHLQEIWEVGMHMDDLDLGDEQGGEEVMRCIQEVNLVRKEMLSGGECKVCWGKQQGKKGKCGLCGEVKHAICGAKVPKAMYYYCDVCQSKLDDNDPAQNMTLQAWLHSPAAKAAMIKGTNDPAEWLQYSFVHGNLVYHRDKGSWVVPPPAERELIIEKVHHELNHVGGDRLKAYLTREYWWPGLANDVAAFQQSCLGCAIQNAVFSREKFIRSHITAVEPRRSWSLDCAPQISVKEGRASLVVAIDDFTKFVIAGVLERLNSGEVAKWFLGSVMAIGGKPQVVRCDNGNEFSGKFASLLKTLGVHQRKVAPHAPWQNGRAERCIRTIKKMLKATMMGSNADSWTELVAYVVSAINHTPSRTTKHTPHELFFGEIGEPLIRDAECPFAADVDWTRLPADHVNVYAEVAKKKIQDAKRRAATAEQRYRETMREDHEALNTKDGIKVAPPRDLKEGDWVIVKRQPVGAWGLKAAGPMVILKKDGARVLLKSLLTQRESWEDRINCRVWRTI